MVTETTSPGDAGVKPFLGGMLCRDCGTRASPFQPVCPSCMSEAVDSLVMPDEGVIYTLTTVHAAPRRWTTPYRVGYVDLPNGVRVFGHLQGAGLAINGRVRLAVGEVGTNADGTPRQQTVFIAAGG